MTNKLSIEQLQRCVEGTEFLPRRELAQQLLDAMRDNDRVRGCLNYIAVGENNTLEGLFEDYDFYLNSCKQSEVKMVTTESIGSYSFRCHLCLKDLQKNEIMPEGIHYCSGEASKTSDDK